MKKLFLCLALCSTLCLCLVACNDDKTPVTSGDSSVSGNEVEENDSPIDDSFTEPDFTSKAGYKVNLGSSFNGVKYDSIFLMNRSTSQLDLVFPDGTIGTMLIDTAGSDYLNNADEVLTVGDVQVSIQEGVAGITVYEWQKDGFSYVYSTTQNLRETERLNNLVNDLAVEVTDASLLH